MKALITGGAGFIGSHLSDVLLDHGHSVSVVDNLSTGLYANVAHLESHPHFSFTRGDVRDPATMQPLVQYCDVVFHLAAAVGVALIVDQPIHAIDTNVRGSQVVLSLAAEFGKRVVLASSSEVYGKNTKVPFNEDDDTTLGATRCSRWSYACTKLLDEFLALAHHEQAGMPITICRLFNTVGPRQLGRYGMVVPRFVRAALRNAPLEIYGTGTQRRCFCNVLDVSRALEELSQCPAAVGEIVNVGADDVMTINALADLVICQAGSRSSKRYMGYEEVYGKPFDDMLVRVPDLVRIRALIGYRPQHSVAETINQVIQYQRSNPPGW